MPFWRDKNCQTCPNALQTNMLTFVNQNVWVRISSFEFMGLGNLAGWTWENVGLQECRWHAVRTTPGKKLTWPFMRTSRALLQIRKLCNPWRHTPFLWNWMRNWWIELEVKIELMDSVAWGLSFAQKNCLPCRHCLAGALFNHLFYTSWSGKGHFFNIACQCYWFFVKC